MTVSELIVKLQNMPQDAPVLIGDWRDKTLAVHSLRRVDHAIEIQQDDEPYTRHPTAVVLQDPLHLD